MQRIWANQLIFCSHTDLKWALHSKHKSMKQISLLALLLLTYNCYSQERLFKIDTIQIQSKVLNENRSIIIYKSDPVSNSDSVTFIYLTDGEYAAYRLQQLEEKFRDSISDVIAVGVINTDRRRDLLYVNGADQFLDFITRELKPFIEKDYVVRKRILFGHSFGGSFTIYAIINQPDAFDEYIASSPTPIMDYVSAERYVISDAACRNKIAFYLSYGSKDMGQVIKWAQKLNHALADQSFKHIEYHFKVFEGKNHNNSDIPALLLGIGQ